MKKVAAELDMIRQDHIRVMSGSDFTTLVIVVDENSRLDADLHRLERQLRAHE